MVILFVVGVAALCASAGLFVQAWRARRGIVVDGTFVANDISSDRVGQFQPRMVTGAPVVQYIDNNGQTHRVTSQLGNSRLPAIGSPIRVSYRSDDPSKAVVLIPQMAVPKMDVPGHRRCLRRHRRGQVSRSDGAMIRRLGDRA